MTCWKAIKRIAVSWFVIRTYLRSISFVRAINAVKLSLSYGLSVVLKKPYAWGYPAALSIEPISVCNLKCPECPTGMGILTRSKGMLTVDSFRHMLSGVHSSLWHLNLYFQGEPYMHPDFFDLVKLAKKRGLIVETSTNGQFMTYKQALNTVRSGLDILVVSLDGTTQEVYEKYRVGGELNRVTEGIGNLVRAKKELGSHYPIIRAQFLAFGHNEHQVSSFEQMSWGLGVDMVEVKRAQVYNVQTKAHLLPYNKSLSRYTLLKDGAVQLKGKIRNRCWKHWSSAVVTWNGDVVPCCFDKDAKYVMGNMHHSSLLEMWKTKLFSDFRRKVLTDQQNIDICENCPLSRG